MVERRRWIIISRVLLPAPGSQVIKSTHPASSSPSSPSSSSSSSSFSSSSSDFLHRPNNFDYFKICANACLAHTMIMVCCCVFVLGEMIVWIVRRCRCIFSHSLPSRFGSALNFCNAQGIVQIFAFSPAACHAIAIHLILGQQPIRWYWVKCHPMIIWQGGCCLLLNIPIPFQLFCQFGLG